MADLFALKHRSICIVVYLVSAMKAALATFAQRMSLGATANVWNFFAEGGG
jgi:hypothetical protein